jgi:hypothetical protein
VLTHFGLMAAPEVSGHVSAAPLQPAAVAIGSINGVRAAVAH